MGIKFLRNTYLDRKMLLPRGIFIFFIEMVSTYEREFNRSMGFRFQNLVTIRKPFNIRVLVSV